MSAAAATTTAPGFDYFSGGSLVPDSVADYPPNFLDSVDRLLQDLDPSTVMIQTLFPSHAMPTPRRVADPTGVYGPQDADSAEAVRHKTSENNVSKRSALPPLLMRSASAAGASKKAHCPPSSTSTTGVLSGSKAIDFASFAAAVLTLVININNNVNNRNNNNNNFNLNAVSSSNIATNSNTNIANQVNIMPTGRQISPEGTVGYAALAALRALQVATDRQ